MILLERVGQKKIAEDQSSSATFSNLGDPAGARTQGPNIKSVVLYQLSYGIIEG